MAVKTIPQLKNIFSNGNVPSESDYEDLIDTFIDAIGTAGYGDMLKSVYDTDDDSQVESADYADTAGDSDTLDGEHADAFADAVHIHAGMGDMLKSVYDTDDDAKVELADYADNADTVDGYHAASFMLQSVYDTNSDGKVNSADVADQLNRTITAGDGLSGGGALTSDVTLNIDLATNSGLSFSSTQLIIDLDTDSGLQLGAGGISLGAPSTLTVSSANLVSGANHSHAITSSSNPGAAASILASDSNGYLQLERIGLGVTPSYPLHIQSLSSTQFRLSYDASNYSNFNVSSAGSLTVAPTGSLYLDPVNDYVLPTVTYDVNLGSPGNQWLSLYAAELNVGTLVAQDVIATIGGEIMVGPTSRLTDSPQTSGGGYSTITFVGSANNVGESVTTVSVAVPAATANGDIMIAQIVLRDGSPPTVATPSGWSEIREDTADTSKDKAKLFWKLASSEPASYNMGASATCARVNATISVYRGVDTSTPIDAHNGQANTSSTSVTAPAVTTSVANCKLVFAGFVQNSITFTPPTSFTEREDNKTPTGGTNAIATEIADYTQASAGSSGSITATASSAGINIGQLLSLLPAYTPAGTTITLEHNDYDIDDIVLLKARGGIEFMSIDSDPSVSGPPYTYDVTRDLDGSGINDWYAGDAVFNTGTTGDGFIDILSLPTRIVGYLRTGTAYNAYEERWAIGNLNTLYGYASTIFGVAFGDPSAIHITIDDDDGFRIINNSTLIGQWDTTGAITIGDSGAGGEYLSLDATNGLQIYSGGVKYVNLSPVGTMFLGDNTGTNSYVTIEPSQISMTSNSNVYFSVTSAGVMTIGYVSTGVENITIDSTNGIRMREGTTVKGSWLGDTVTIGEIGASLPNILLDSTNGVQIRNYTTTLGQWDTDGDLFLGDQADAYLHYDLSAHTLTFHDENGSPVVTMNGAATAGGGYLDVGLPGPNVRLAADGLNLRYSGTSDNSYVWWSPSLSSSYTFGTDTGAISMGLGAGSGEFYGNISLGGVTGQYMADLYMSVYSDPAGSDVDLQFHMYSNSVSESLFEMSFDSVSQWVLKDDGVSIKNALYVGSTSDVLLDPGSLILNQGANDTDIIRMISSDVAHGITTIVSTNVYAQFTKLIGSEGGLRIRSLTEGTQSMQIEGIATIGNTTRSTSALGAVAILGRKKSGTSVGVLGTNENILVVYDDINARFLVDKEGDIHMDATSNINAWDDHDDIALLTGLRASVMDPKAELAKRASAWIEYARPILEATGVMTYNEDGHHFVSMKSLQWLQIDAIRQLHEANTRLEQRLAIAEQQLISAGLV